MYSLTVSHHVMIAHSLTTVQHADQICVLDHGRLCERGTHTTLLAAGGVYARLYELQQSRAVAAGVAFLPPARHGAGQA